MKNKNKLNVYWIIACMILMCFPLSIHASETGTIEVDNQLKEDVGVIHVELFKVADMVQGSLHTTSEFQSQPLSMSDLETSSAQEQKASFYISLIEENQIQPVRSATCDAKGMVKFEQVEDGIYLLRQYQTSSQQRFHAKPFFVQMPMYVNGNVQYHVVTHPKVVIDQSSERSITVVKQWKDNNDQYKKRPTSISVGLFKNDTLLHEVTLDALNNWSYEWNQLDVDAHYRVEELQVPKEYRMSVMNMDDHYTIINQLVIQRDDITHGFVDIVTGNHGSIHSVITGDETAVVRYLMLFGGSLACISVYVLYKRKENKKS